MGVDEDRNHGVYPAPISQYMGPADGDGSESMSMKFPTVGYENPGPTANLRGVEANTELMARHMAPDATARADQDIPPINEIGAWTPPMNAPDSSGLNSSKSSHPSGWNGPDRQNVRPLVIVQDSYDEMGEHYPGNPMGVNDEPY